MNIDSEITTIQRDPFGRIIPVASSGGSVRPHAREQENAARNSAVQNYDSGFDTAKFSRWQNGLAQALEDIEQERTLQASEQAYREAGRKAARSMPSSLLNSEETASALSAPSLYAAAQAGTVTGTQFFSPGLSADRTDSNSGGFLQPGNNTRADSAGSVKSGEAFQGSGADEARSAERTFAGGVAANSGLPQERRAGMAGSSPGAAEKNGANILDEKERQEVEELKSRDQEVRTHEQAHVSAGGGLVQGGPSYQKTTGPDGKQYAVAGEVQIDTSGGPTPESTIAKARQVRAAALAPAQPSAQDMQVAAKASQMEAEAQRQNVSDTSDASDERKNGVQAREPGVMQKSEAEQDGPEHGKEHEKAVHVSRRASLAYERASAQSPAAYARIFSLAV